jgi:Zn-dependent protease with chaperone function
MKVATMREPNRPSPAVLRQEAARRRAILLGIATLLVLSMSGVFGHHLPIWFDTLLHGRDHLRAVCLIALHALMQPVHSAFHLLFFAGLAYAIVDRVRAWRTLRAVLDALAVERPRAGDAYTRASFAADLDPSRLRLVHGLPTPAFTTGWLRPRVYAAAALPDQLSAAELAAVLAHEAEHVRRRDPLRLFVLRFVGCLLFWVPAMRSVAADYAAENEVRADDAAAERHGLALASALLRLADWRAPAPAGAAIGFNGGDLLERRVLRLTGEEVPPRSRLTRRSITSAAAALLLAWTAGIAVGHPMPQDHEAHCNRSDRAAVFHLFCAFSRSPVTAEDCPHGVAAP